MEPLNDIELRDLLRQWEAPAVPAPLERRIFPELRKEPWHRWMLSGSIRVPAPVLVLLLLILSALAYVLPRSRQASPAGAREISFSDFQPVAEPKLKIIRRAYESN